MSSSHLCNWGNLAEVIGSCQSPNPTSKDCNCSHELFIEEEKNGQQAYFFYFAQNKFQINQKVREILLTYSTVTLFSNKADIQITRRQYLWMSADMFGNEDVKIDCALTIVPSAWLCLAVFLALRAKDRKCKVQSSFKYSFGLHCWAQCEKYTHDLVSTKEHGKISTQRTETILSCRSFICRNNNRLNMHQHSKSKRCETKCACVSEWASPAD